MKCINCSAEIKSEFNICPYCGTPVQMVPDYNVYDEDDINVLLEETKDVESKNNKAYIREQKIKQEQERKKALKVAQLKKERNKKIMILGSCVAAFILVIGIVLGGIISKNNSYDYQMKQADAAMFEEDYDTAEKYYKKAIAIEPDNIKVRIKLADLYIEKDEIEDALKLLQEVVEKDASNLDAYKRFYTIYDKKNDTEAIMELLENVTDNKILAIFGDYVVKAPELSESSGEFGKIIRLEIDAKKGLEIYYTLDGTDPRKNGIKYEDIIELITEGEHTVKVVTKNSAGYYSKVITETYEIKFVAPEDPVVSPDGGTFMSPAYINIVVPEDCSVFYTWDRTDPSIYSSVYTSPIPVPEGYNVLSVVVIDNYSGLQSAVYRGAFEYIAD